MRRPLLLATALLAVLTALSLLGAAVAVRPPPLPGEADAPREAANRALAYRFYDAANAAIATGDATALAALVAPDFVERSGRPDALPDRDALVDRLLAIHAVAPGARLVPESVAADGDLVIASVRVGGASSPAFLGLRLDGAWTAWGPVDAFRVGDDRIVERRGPVVDPVPLGPGLRVALKGPLLGQQALAAARLRLAPGALHVAPPRDGLRLLVADSGTVDVIQILPAADRDGERRVPPAAPASALRATDHLVLPTRAGFTVRNTGPWPAALLDVAIVAQPHMPPSSAPSSPADVGVAVKPLADNLLIDVPSPPAVLALGRATLDPGERLAWAPAAGPVLVHVEAGELDLMATGSVPWVDGSVSRRSEAGVEAVLAAGDGALLEAGAAVEIRAGPGGPAALLVLTLLPADQPAPNSLSGPVAVRPVPAR